MYQNHVRIKKHDPRILPAGAYYCKVPVQNAMCRQVLCKCVLTPASAAVFCMMPFCPAWDSASDLAAAYRLICKINSTVCPGVFLLSVADGEIAFRLEASSAGGMPAEKIEAMLRYSVLVVQHYMPAFYALLKQEHEEMPLPDDRKYVEDHPHMLRKIWQEYAGLACNSNDPEKTI